MGTPNPFKTAGPNFSQPDYYDAFMENVREEAKKRGREVLEWQPEDGWKPLCEFLGKPVPPDSVPFPKTNETAEIKKAIRILYVLGALSWMCIGGLGYVAVQYGPYLAGLARAKLALW
jgi:hypothetical protein